MIQLKCLESSKAFKRGKVYLGVAKDNHKGSYYKVEGENGRTYLCKADKFEVVVAVENVTKATKIEKAVNGKSNKEAIRSFCKEQGLIIGCYDKFVDKVNKTNLKKILDAISYQDATDLVIRHEVKQHVISIDFVGSEVDLTHYTKQEYINCFGSEKFED